MFDILGFRLSFWVILSFSCNACNDLCQWAVQLDIPEVMDAGTVLRRSLVTILAMWLSHKFTTFDPGFQGRPGKFHWQFFLAWASSWSCLDSWSWQVSRMASFFRNGKKVRLILIITKKQTNLQLFLDRCHWKKLRCARQGIEQRRPKGTFLFPQAYFRLPFVRWQTRNPTRDYRTSWRSVDVNNCSLLFRLRVLYQCRHQPMHSLSKVLI